MRRINSEANLGTAPVHSLNNGENRPPKQQITYEPCKLVPPTDGIPFEFLISKINELRIDCSICHNLIWEPYVLEDCQHTFCKFCILKWLSQKKNCPECRQIPKKHGISKDLLKLFGLLKIKCMNKNCQQTTDYSSLIDHLEKCEFRMFRCTNEKCKYIGLKKEVEKHCLNCEFRLEECPYCHKLVIFSDLENHAKTVCEKECKCPKCYTVMTRGKYFSEHYSVKNENVQCLKAQMNKLMESKKKHEKYIEKLKLEKKSMENNFKEKIKEMENERNILKNENKNLRGQLNYIEDSFDNFYKLIKKKDKLNIMKNDEEDNKNESKINNTTEVDKSIENLKISNQKSNNKRNKGSKLSRKNMENMSKSYYDEDNHENDDNAKNA